MRKISYVLFAVVAVLIFQACGGSPSAKLDLAYKYMGKRGVVGSFDRYTFEYSLNNGPFQQLDIYVQEEKLNYLITVGSVNKTSFNNFVYDSNKAAADYNFVYPVSMERAQVQSLDEAITLSMKWYLAYVTDNEKLEKKAEE